MNKTKMISTVAVMVFVALAIPALVLGQTYAGDMGIDPEDVQLGKAEYSPYLDQGYPDRVYFGDTHLHTSYSTDAGMFGTRLGPEEAYRFALGEEVTSNTGLRVRLQRSLDFLVVADHAENLGLAPMIAESNPELLRSEWGRMVHDLVKSGDGAGAYRGKKSLRGGIIDHTGKFADVVTRIVINHFLCLITTARHGPSIGSFEKPVVLVVAFDAKTAFMHQPVVL